MTEFTQRDTAPNQVPLNDKDTIGLGAAAILDPSSTMRVLNRQGLISYTNLPVGIDPFQRPVESGPYSDIDNNPEFASFWPHKLDSLPEGSFRVVSQVVAMALEAPAAERYERKIIVSGNEFGQTVDTQADTWDFVRGTERIREALGFKIKDGAVIGMPTPETVKAAAARQGVFVRLLADYGTIPPEDYLKSFAAGEYPIATMTEENYRHDIEDDHLTAIVLGGGPLRIGLQEAAVKNLLPTGDVNGCTDGIDTYTGLLRLVVSPHPQRDSEHYGTLGRQSLIVLGEEIGISADTTNEIIKTAQENALHFGMKVRELA